MTLSADQVLDLIKNQATGLSSQGMLDWLVEGNTDPATYTGYWPADNGDLGRCQRTYDALPAEEQKIVAPLLALFTQRIEERNAVYAEQVKLGEERRTARLAELAHEKATAPGVTLHLTGAQAVALRNLLADADMLDIEDDDLDTLGDIAAALR